MARRRVADSADAGREVVRPTPQRLRGPEDSLRAMAPLHGFRRDMAGWFGAAG
ncbi:hypothetical protein ACIQGZ_17890 [Streptomyces sp. NPDC092296]|uniref:hypothetical protein n=1 Tax=Streptomyces sp. NPDC092296 TaxID=3366012 RepID=UPI0038054D95